MSETSPHSDAPDLGRCAHANLRRAMRLVSQLYDEALRPSGLRATQFTLLAVLARRGPMPMTRLADLLVLDRTTLTRNLKPLAARGLIEDGREEDERVRLVAATPAGARAVAEAVPLWQGAQSRLAAGLGEQRLAGLIGGLQTLVDEIRGD